MTFDELAEAYREATVALIEGGADVIIIETIFDTLNAKAAYAGVEQAFDEVGCVLPIMISGTITDLSGRTLSGQTPTAFWASMQHARPLSIGLNCALGAREMRAHLAELSRVADTMICAYPNAGLPNEFGLYDESPEYMAGLVKEFAESGLVNVLGGCCGTTPPHIHAIAKAIEGIKPREVPEIEPMLRLSGLEPFALTPDIRFVNVGERTNVTGSARFRKLIKEGRPHRGARRRARPGRQRCPGHRHQHGRGPARFAEGDGRVPQPRRRRARHRPRAGHDRFLEVRDHRGRPEVRAGQGRRELDLDEGGRGEVHCRRPNRAPLRRRRRRHGLRREGPGRFPPTTARLKSVRRAYDILDPRRSASLPQDIIFDPNVLTVATGIEEHNNYAVDFIEATR